MRDVVIFIAQTGGSGISVENGLGRSLEYQLGGSLNRLEERMMVQIKAVSV